MKRRHFLQIAGAAGFAPALPIATTAPVAPTAIQYAWARHYAQVHGTVSQARLTAALRLPLGVAESLMKQMTAQGVIAAPSACGISRASKRFHNPLQSRPLSKSLRTRVKTTLDQVQKLRSQAERVETDPLPSRQREDGKSQRQDDGPLAQTKL